MADYYTQFSCILDVGTAENAARADMIRGELAAELDRHEGESLGFRDGRRPRVWSWRSLDP